MKPFRSRLPLGLLGMLALVAAVETGLARHPLQFVDTATLSWRLGLEAVPREAARCEVVCLGDSLVKIGVMPEVIQRGTGHRAYNFAMAQAPAPATFFLLRRLLDAGARPRAIVVDFKPSVLAGGPKFSLRHWQEVLSVRECLEIARIDGKPRLLAEIALGRLLPSYRDRFEIREAIGSAFRGERAPTYRTNLLALRNWGMNLGAHRNTPKSTFTGQVEPEIHQKLLSDHWQCHRVNAVYVDRLLAMAEKYQIPVYWLIPPLPPEMQTRREQTGVDAAFVAFVRSILVKHPGVIIVDGRRSQYQADTFADHTHLNGRGANALSHELAAILAHPQARERWIELPRFRDWPMDARAEDIEQSRIVLEAEAVRR